MNTQVAKTKATKQPPLTTIEDVKDTSLVAPEKYTGEVDLAAWGVSDQTLTEKDVIIPRIFVMQGSSKPVLAGEAKFGEIRESKDGIVVGDPNHPFEFIPVYAEKTYTVMKIKQGTSKFHKSVPITSDNEDQDYEVKCTDGDEKWYRTINFYVLLPHELTKVPYVLSFRSSSLVAGKNLYGTMYRDNLMAGATPFSLAMELSVNKKTNEKGTFMVMDVKSKRKSTIEEIEKAKFWVTCIRAGKHGGKEIKVTDASIESEGTESSAPVAESTEF